MLDAPGRFERAAAVGPIARRASDLGRWITDPAITATVTVTTGDGLAVSELLELLDTLEERMGHGPALVVANRLAPLSPASAELAALARLGESLADLPAHDRLVDAIEHVATRARSERAQLGRVTKRVGVPPVRAFERPGYAVESIAEALRTDPLPDELVESAAHADQQRERRAHDRRSGERRSLPGQAERR